MAKIIYSFSVSLDGYIESKDHSLDWVIIDEELHRHFNAEMKALGAEIYGRRLYELMSGYWPKINDDSSVPVYIAEYAHLWKEKPKIVFSKTLKEVQWNSRLVRDDITGEIARLKAQPGMDMSVGGARLAASFMRLGLIDEYSLYLQPVILGGGTRMFPELQEAIKLQLIETRKFKSGVIMLRYRRMDSGPGR